jgi:hypothetical protein
MMLAGPLGNMDDIGHAMGKDNAFGLAAIQARVTIVGEQRHWIGDKLVGR